MKPWTDPRFWALGAFMALMCLGGCGTSDEKVLINNNLASSPSSSPSSSVSPSPGTVVSPTTSPSVSSSPVNPFTSPSP